MKILMTYFAAFTVATAATTLNPGDAVKPDSIVAATLVQGAVPKEWEKDKLYILECWATWCGPCIRVIPHVNELHKELADQGLRVIGVNVFEDGLEKVDKFVKAKGDGMAYPVVYVGKKGQFENEWLKPAGVRGIPHAFVVKNGKLLFTTHPSRLSKELVGDLLAGGEKEAAALKLMEEAAAKRAVQEAAAKARPKDPTQEKIRTFMTESLVPLIRNNEYDKAAAEAEAFIKDNPEINESSKASLILNARMSSFINNGDSEGAAKFIDELAATYPESIIAKSKDRLKESTSKRIEAMAKKAAGPKTE